MRQSITQFMKCILRIAIFSFGGLLAITGIMSGSYALVQLPDGASKFMPCVVSALFILPAGIYLCFLAIKVPHYLAESRKMSKEERVIENIKTYMKKGKSRIAALTFLLIFMVSTLIWILWQEKKLNETINPEKNRLMASFERPQRELPILFSRFYTLGRSKSKLIVYECYFGVFTGFIIAMLIIEISGLTKNKHKLTLSMWERIQQLENEVKDLKAHTQADDQQIDGMDGEDVVVN